MENYDVKKLALVLAKQAEIDGMKAANSQHPENQPFTCEDFERKAAELRDLSCAYNEQLQHINKL